MRDELSNEYQAPAGPRVQVARSRVAPSRVAGDRVGRIRVTRIIDRLNIGGPAKHVVWLAAGLNPQEFETVLVTGTVPPGEGDMGYFARAAGIEPVVIEEMSRELSPRDIIVAVKLILRFFKLKPRVVHTHKAKAGAVGRVAATIYKWMTPTALWLRPRRVHIVHTYHGHIFHSYYGPAKTRLFLAIERLLARFCTDRIVVISEQQRREIHERFRVGSPEQFRVVPLGIDFDEMDDRGGQAGLLREEFRIREDEVAVGIVGRLCEVKNHSMFVEAAALVLEGLGDPAGEPGAAKPERAAEPRFVIIGDGHLRQRAERQARELGISDRVTFTGFRRDATSLYPGLDLLALTSLNEGTPLTLIEALYCGRAVAATEVGGVIDVMGQRRESIEGFSVWDHGVTAPDRDVKAFARALSFLIERPELRRQMGERGRAFVRARMSRTRLTADVEDLYRDLVGPWAPRPSPEPVSLNDT